MHTRANGDGGMVRDGNVSPPRPRRDAHLPREREQRVRRAAPVAARDHQRAAHSRHRRGNHRRYRRFPLAQDCFAVDLVRGGEFIDLRRVAENADQDQVRRQRPSERRKQARLDAGDLLHICRKSLSRDAHGLWILRRDVDRRRPSVGNDREACRGRRIEIDQR